MSVALEASRLHVRHSESERDALRDVSLRLEPGEVLALVGPNGSGKSTLLSALGRALPPRTGDITLDGTTIGRLPTRAFARRVARLPQDPETPEGLVVEDLVAFGRHPHRGLLGALDRRDRGIVGGALAVVGLADERKRRVETLSGGERRRAWLAMVLAQEPEILLLDEPTAALDLRQQWELLHLLRRLNAERHVGIVASMHELEQATWLADRLAVLHRGRMYAVGKPVDVVDPEMLLDVYGVEAEVTHPEVHRRGLSIRVTGPGDPLRSL